MWSWKPSLTCADAYSIIGQIQAGKVRVLRCVVADGSHVVLKCGAASANNGSKCYATGTGSVRPDTADEAIHKVRTTRQVTHGVLPGPRPDQRPGSRGQPTNASESGGLPTRDPAGQGRLPGPTVDKASASNSPTKFSVTTKVRLSLACLACVSGRRQLTRSGLETCSQAGLHVSAICTGQPTEHFGQLHDATPADTLGKLD